MGDKKRSATWDEVDIADAAVNKELQKRQEYYAKNKADAAKKEAAKDYEIFGSRGDAARKGMEEGKMNPAGDTYKKGGKVSKSFVKSMKKEFPNGATITPMKKGGSASSRADGIAMKGKTKGKIC